MERLPYKDFTLKSQVEDLARLEEILIKSGSKFIGSDKQKDTYFETDRGKLKLRQGTLENLITHYERIEEDGIERTLVFRYDLNPTADAIQILFSDHKVIGVIEKERKIFYVGDVKVHLDTLPDKRMFVELEAIDRTDLVDAAVLRDKCGAVKEMLGIKDQHLVKTGYFTS